MSDNINNPKHYTYSKIQTLDAIEAWGLNFHLANVVKYVSRAGKKDPSKEIEDLKKAQFYLNRHIENLEKEKDAQSKTTT